MAVPIDQVMGVVAAGGENGASLQHSERFRFVWCRDIQRLNSLPAGNEQHVSRYGQPGSVNIGKRHRQ